MRVKKCSLFYDLVGSCRMEVVISFSIVGNDAMRKQQSFAAWQPSLAPADVFGTLKQFSELRCWQDNLFYLESRPEEKGRTVLMRRQVNRQLNQLTPEGFSLRSRVYEYGGGVYAIGYASFGLDSTFLSVFFVNDQDQRIYRQAIEKPELIFPVIPETLRDGSQARYSDLTLSPDGRWLVMVMEKEGKNGRECGLAAIDLYSIQEQEPKFIIQDHDFYSSPCFSPSGEELVFVAWEKPYMPWDSSTLYSLDWEQRVYPKIIRGGVGISVMEPQFDPEGRLYFLQDERSYSGDDYQNFWNLYRRDQVGKIIPLTKEVKEFGYPRWVGGSQCYDLLPGNDLVAQREGELVLIFDRAEPEPIATSWQVERYQAADSEGNIFFVGKSWTESDALVMIDPKGREQIIAVSGDIPLSEEDISVPRLKRFQGDTGRSYGWWYPPQSSSYSPRRNEKPPLLVMAHGGPTSAAKRSLDLRKQFFTSQGFAILDLDYRGSTGYGRVYRELLDGHWGEYDVEDAADAVRHLMDKKKVDRDKVFIRGSSAGGLLVMLSLIQYPELYAGGASYYGVSNLEVLDDGTHAFETDYTAQLLGGSKEERPDLYWDLSPHFLLDQLQVPMILFHGAEDKVVPPTLSREIAGKLEELGMEHEYHEYPGEGHGFRQKEHQIHSLEREVAFYRRIMEEK